LQADKSPRVVQIADDKKDFAAVQTQNTSWITGIVNFQSNR
jgi:hypothetical protein